MYSFSRNINQWTPELVGNTLDSAAILNDVLFPFSILLPIFFITVTLGLIYYCYKRPGFKSSTYLKLFLAFVYMISGLQALLGEIVRDGLNTVSSLFVGVVGLLAMWLVSLLILLDIYWNKTFFDFTLADAEYKSVKIAGFILMFTGIVIYPLVEILLGFTWPTMVFFGAECPTTIFLIGLLLSATPRTNKLFILILGINAIITGGSFATMGFPVDFQYAVAGIIGLITVVVYWRDIPIFPLKQDS
ncbi:MAG: DUF6064 family protein [Candidatus Odinarchaeota archaeon]